MDKKETKMNVSFSPLTEADRTAVVDLFNHYIENSFAAYPEQKIPYDFFDVLMNMCKGYPTASVKNTIAEVIGFGMLRPYNPIPAFAHTAEITCFLKPQATGQGIGRQLLSYLVQQAQEKGIRTLLASISSLNEGSIRFHRANGFEECGRFKDIGRKNGRLFDVVYMQRKL